MSGVIGNALTGGIPGAVSAVAQFAGKILDRAIPDPAARLAAEAEMNRQDHEMDLADMAAETGLLQAQAATNTEEAKSESLFVAGWRPLIGWIMGIGIGQHLIFNPWMYWITHIFRLDIPAPTIDLQTVLLLLPGMLGMKLRTDEKLAGASSVVAGH